jgi:hypothetical protein
VAPMADGGACTALARGEKGGFYSRLEAIGCSLCAKTVGSGYGRWHGKYGDVWEAACVGLRTNGGEAVHRPAIGRDTCGPGLLPRPHHLYVATVRKTPRTDRRLEAGLGVRAPGGGSARRDAFARDVARVARVGSFEIHLALFEPIFLQIFELKWSKR